MKKANIKIISAGAGSGKTYRLTQEMVALLRGGTRASGIIATTFTSKAAAELAERVRTKLLEEGLTAQANDLSNALIGTVHGLGVKLLKRFAFEAGVSPQVDIMAEEDSQIFFNRSLSQIMTQPRVERINGLADTLGLTKKGAFDWRRVVQQLVDTARANAFDRDILEQSKVLSFRSFQTFLGEKVSYPGDYNAELIELLNETIGNISAAGDETKVTNEGIGELKTLRNELQQRTFLYWHQWVKITKIKVGAKCRDLLEPLSDFAQKHAQFADFQSDVENYIASIFDVVIDALSEFERFKKQRGLIDYTDMEVLVRGLLANPSVLEVLREELDLLMVDEFQDTSPIQLDIFLKLSQIAKHSIWVGDPKQSIYGFRGAEPRLMQAILAHVGIKDEDILKDSWRSRPDIVAATNAVFCRAFADLPTEQVALNAKREDKPAQTDALIHWHFSYDNGGDTRKKQPGSPWTEGCIAESIKVFLERETYILPKGEKNVRTARAGDIAVLCRTNDQCQTIADALHRAGLKAAMSRTGLLETAEAKLILAVLRYILNKHDSLAVAEILLLASRQHLSDILENRLDFLEKIGENYDWRWAHDNDWVKQINDLRRETVELSSNEILNLILEELDLRRIIAAWGNTTQRLENVDVIRKFSLQYENACNRLNAAASLGGFLLWLARLSEREKDTQSSGTGTDAVNVLTYHKSKGLEYPIVVMGNLEQSLRDDVFGIALDTLPEKAALGDDAIDLNNILAGRWLRFWVNPYADQIGRTQLEERINASEAKRKVTLAALAEEARLLYVGITRARDYLIFPTTQTPTRWLNRAWHSGNEDYPTLDEGNETHFEWAGKYLSKDFETFWYTKDFGYVPKPIETIPFIEARTGKGDFSAYKIDFEKENLAIAESKNGSATALDMQNYALPLLLKEDATPSVVARVFAAILRAYQPDLSFFTENEAIAESLTERFDASDMIDYQKLMQQAHDFFQFLNQKYEVQNWTRGYAISGHFEGRFFETEIDFVAQKNLENNFEGKFEKKEAENEVVILIKNSLFSGDSRKNKTEAERFVSEFYLATKAIAEEKKATNFVCLVHFVLQGIVVQIPSFY